jgi:DNA-binding sugar fermentation-stimulating protein
VREDTQTLSDEKSNDHQEDKTTGKIQENMEDTIVRQSLIEVKNVVCTDVKANLAPKKRGINHCVIVSETEPYSRTALFPWGRVGQTFEGNKVVSERAIKHLRNLANLSSMPSSLSSSSPTTRTSSSPTTTTSSTNFNGIVLFVVNRSDCESMRACHEACPIFASELKAAVDKGCTVVSFKVHWTTDGKAYFDRIVPVKL